MPRFFFHRLEDAVEYDDEGVELTNADAARVEAMLSMGETLKDGPSHVWRLKDVRIEVTDERGNLLFTIITLAIDAPAVIEISDP